MTKTAVLSNKIIITPKTEDQMIYMRNATTYKFIDEFKTRLAGREIGKIVRTYNLVGPGTIALPIGRQELIPEDYDIKDARIQIPVEFPEPATKYILRDSQKEVYDAVTDNCMINAPVSWGKTFTALYIAKKLKQKTLVITHTTILRDQWAAEVKKLYNINAGIIGGGSMEGMNKPIVVGNVQTIIKYIDQLVDSFGTIIVDECHHTPSTTFSDILSKLRARYKIGLSGTLLRKDGQHILFKDYFSSTIYRPEIENSLTPLVVQVYTNIAIPPADHWAHRVTELCSLESYRQFITNISVKMADKGHKVLVIGERVDFLESIARRCGDTAICITGALTDNEKRVKLMNEIRSGEKTILCGSRNIFSEGVSLDELSCLVIASPIANEINLTQLIGRIQRVCPGKKSPVVIDPQLTDNSSKKQQKARMEYYIRSGYKIYSLANF